VLTDGTRVDSVPNLEILTGEVLGAGHASTSGGWTTSTFLPDGRGIPEARRRLVIQGFFGELIAQSSARAGRAVAAAIERELAGSRMSEESFQRACALADVPPKACSGAARRAAGRDRPAEGEV